MKRTDILEKFILTNISSAKICVVDETEWRKKVNDIVLLSFTAPSLKTLIYFTIRKTVLCPFCSVTKLSIETSV